MAQVDETRARVFLAEGKYREANRVIAGPIQSLEKGSASAVLADAFTVQGVIWARLGLHESSITILHRAIQLGEESGALANAGLAALTLVEEHAARISQREVFNAYLDADRLLKDVQNGECLSDLRAWVFRAVIGKYGLVRGYGPGRRTIFYTGDLGDTLLMCSRITRCVMLKYEIGLFTIKEIADERVKILCTGGVLVLALATYFRGTHPLRGDRPAAATDDGSAWGDRRDGRRDGRGRSDVLGELVVSALTLRRG